jgi:3-hydroxybutyryl-CoA dehydratase
VKVGDAAEMTRIFTADDVAALADLGGPKMAAGAVPEPLIGALFSYVLGVELPGPGTNYLKQQSEYLGQAHIGELLSARVEVVRLRPDKRLVDLATQCRGHDGRLVARGRALVYAADVEGAFE